MVNRDPNFQPGIELLSKIERLSGAQLTEMYCILQVPSFGRTILLHRRRTLEERRIMSRPTKTTQVKRAKTFGPTENTGAFVMAPSIEVGVETSNFIPTVFRWWTNPSLPMEEQPKNVRLFSYLPSERTNNFDQCRLFFET